MTFENIVRIFPSECLPFRFSCIHAIRQLIIDMRLRSVASPQCLHAHDFLLQVSRSIGDAYMKRAEFNREPLLPKFRLPEPFHNPILRAEPTISVQKLFPEDKFLIFASDGLWEHLTNQQAVDIVQSCPRNVRSHIQYLINLFYFSLFVLYGYRYYFRILFFLKYFPVTTLNIDI